VKELKPMTIKLMKKKPIKLSPKKLSQSKITPNFSLNAKKNMSGFTLVEVLVASVILFSVIATVSMVYRGAFLSSEKANNHINISGVLPSVLANIRTDIRDNSLENSLSGKSEAWGVNYQWQASVIEQKYPPKKFDDFTHQISKAKIYYKLWQVSLTLEYNGLTKQHVFKELSWVNE
jgi:prepilin-type N-terminal cleavage/methylation domain-containing protein